MKNEDRIDREVTLLKKDKTYCRVPEETLTKEMLDECLFFMVNSSDEYNPRNFIVAKPNKRHIFDKAIIDYQLVEVAVFENEEQYFDEFIKPVHIETDSLTVLMDILSSIDRLMLVDQYLSDEYCGEHARLDVGSMYIELYYKGERTYGAAYEYNGHSGNGLFNPYPITKRFDKIYKPITYLPGVSSEDTMFLSSDGTWCLDKIDKDGLIGIISHASATVTFISKKEYNLISKLNRTSATLSVFEAKSQEVADNVNDLIEYGKYDKLDPLANNLDFYISNTVELWLNSHKRSMAFMVDSMAHANFIVRSVDLLFNTAYGDPKYEIMENINHGLNVAVLNFDIEDDAKTIHKQVYITSRATIKLNVLLSQL